MPDHVDVRPLSRYLAGSRLGSELTRQARTGVRADDEDVDRLARDHRGEAGNGRHTELAVAPIAVAEETPEQQHHTERPDEGDPTPPTTAATGLLGQGLTGRWLVRGSTSTSRSSAARRLCLIAESSETFEIRPRASSVVVSGHEANLPTSLVSTSSPEDQPRKRA